MSSSMSNIWSIQQNLHDANLMMPWKMFVSSRISYPKWTKYARTSMEDAFTWICLQSVYTWRDLFTATWPQFIAHGVHNATCDRDVGNVQTTRPYLLIMLAVCGPCTTAHCSQRVQGNWGSQMFKKEVAPRMLVPSLVALQCLEHPKFCTM